MEQWNSSVPIFVQIRQKVVELILTGKIAEGEAVPSIRQTASDLSVNPLTVTKAYQALVDAEIIEKKRGLGMFVKAGAKDVLLAQERERFVSEDWPQIAQQIKMLGIDVVALMEADKSSSGGDNE